MGVKPSSNYHYLIIASHVHEKGVQMAVCDVHSNSVSIIRVSRLPRYRANCLALLLLLCILLPSYLLCITKVLLFELTVQIQSAAVSGCEG
jgi:hypothetical protein